MIDQNEKCKISNFTHLVHVKENETASADIPTSDFLKLARWMAPESMRRKCFSTASDVWSFGVLQWEMKNPTKEPYDVSNTTLCPVN